MTTSTTDADAQVRVRFTTRFTKYRVPETAFSVPQKLNRYGLSEIINHLLEHDTPVPFDFSLQGFLLRSSLRRFLRSADASGLSTEDVLDIEYFPAVPAPTPDAPRNAPDWVASIGSTDTLAVAGSYDGSLSVHRTAACPGGGPLAPAHIVRGHWRPVKSLCVASALGIQHSVVISGGDDSAVKVWYLRDADTDKDSRASLECMALGEGHGSEVSATAIAQGLTLAATGAWGGDVCIWSLDPEHWMSQERVTASQPRKRRRRAADDASPISRAKLFARFGAHAQAVSGIVWTSDQELATASWDHTLRLWDVDRIGTEAGREGLGAAMRVISSGKVVTSCASSPGGSRIATAHPDAAIRIWDVRESSSSGPSTVLRGLGGWVHSVTWSPETSQHLASAGQDGRVLLWDVRAPSMHLHEATRHEGQAFGVAFVGDAALCSGGEDTKVRMAHWEVPERE